MAELCACMMGPNDPDPDCAVCHGSGDPSMARLEGWQVAFSMAAQAMCNHGIPISCPWEGDLDDAEKEHFDGLVAAIDSYLKVFPPGRTPAEGKDTPSHG